jgi:hypothetical protein
LIGTDVDQVVLSKEMVQKWSRRIKRYLGDWRGDHQIMGSPDVSGQSLADFTVLY